MAFRRHQLNYKVLNDLKNRSRIGVIFYIVLAIVVLYSGGYYQKHITFSLFFFPSICVVSTIRLIHVFLLFDKIGKISDKLNAVLFFVTVLFTAGVWGISFTLYMVMEGDFYSKFLMAICTVGLSAGGIVAFIPDRRLGIAFIVLMMLPAAVILTALGMFLSLALMIFLYVGYMMLLTFRGNNEYWNALENEMKLQEKSETLKRISRIDVLTGLHNRRCFDDALESSWKAASREAKLLTMVIGDIDNFKDVNDTYGHLAGDEYLKKVATELKTVFKRDTDFVARYGGEEFVVLLPDTNSMIAFEMAERVRKNLESSGIEYNNKEIKTTISFGISSIVPYFKESESVLVSQADAALYQAKKEGRNRIKLG